jgi:hypothetical protein
LEVVKLNKMLLMGQQRGAPETIKEGDPSNGGKRLFRMRKRAEKNPTNTWGFGRAACNFWKS